MTWKVYVGRNSLTPMLDTQKVESTDNLKFINQLFQKITDGKIHIINIHVSSTLLNLS